MLLLQLLSQVFDNIASIQKHAGYGHSQQHLSV